MPQDDLTLAKNLSRIIARAEAGLAKSLLDKVALVLRDETSARDSDIDLSIKLIRRFYPEFVDASGKLDVNDLFSLPKFYDIQRHRAHIQNDLGLYQASPDVQETRKRRAQSFTERYSGANEPSRNVAVFADESGKTDEYLVFGSFWVYRPHDYVNIEAALTAWRNEQSYTGEFHFTRMGSASHRDRAQDFVARAIAASPFSAFIALVIPNRELPQNKRNAAIYKGLAELLIKGLSTELSSGRLTRPLNVVFCKDADPSADRLEIASMKRQIHDAFRSEYPEGDVNIGEVQALDSKRSDFVQLADLFTGAVSRYLNQGEPNAGGNAKEAFAADVGASLMFFRDGDGQLRAGRSFSRIIYLSDKD